MPHVSKQELSKKEFSHLYKNLIHSVVQSKDKEILDNFFWEFLTYTEKIMLSKRLAVILLLEKGLTPYEIWKALKVSSSTVGRIGKDWERGKYTHITKLLKRQDSKLWKALEGIVELFTPPVYYVSRKNFIESKKKQGGY